MQPADHDKGLHMNHSGKSKSSLSHAQKEYIAQKYTYGTYVSVFTTQMLEDPTCPCSEYQLRHQSRLRQSIYDFTRNTPKFLKGDMATDSMSLEVIYELLMLLKAPLEQRSEKAPTGESNHSYFKSIYWTRYLWKYIQVLKVTKSSKGDILTILFAPIDLKRRAADMCRAFPGHKVQLEGQIYLPFILKLSSCSLVILCAHDHMILRVCYHHTH